MVCYTEVRGEMSGEGVNAGPTLKRLVFCMGGHPFIKHVSKYDVDLDTWEDVCPMPIPDFSFNCVAVKHFIYVFMQQKGTILLKYNIHEDSWDSFRALGKTSFY